MKTGKMNICLTAIWSSVFSFLSLAIITMLPLPPAIISCEMTNNQSYRLGYMPSQGLL